MIFIEVVEHVAVEDGVGHLPRSANEVHLQQLRLQVTVFLAVSLQVTQQEPCRLTQQSVLHEDCHHSLGVEVHGRVFAQLARHFLGLRGPVRRFDHQATDQLQVVGAETHLLRVLDCFLGHPESVQSLHHFPVTAGVAEDH